MHHVAKILHPLDHEILHDQSLVAFGMAARPIDNFTGELSPKKQPPPSSRAPNSGSSRSCALLQAALPNTCRSVLDYVVRWNAYQ